MSELIKKLDETKKAFSSQSAMRLRALSKKSIKEAVIENSREMALVSVISYSLSKLCSKEHFVKSPKWKDIKTSILSYLEKAIKLLKSGKRKEFQKSLRDLIKRIESVDIETGNYVMNLIQKGRVKSASTAYALGQSLSQAASLTGANKKDLQNYIGRTKMHDEEGIALGIEKRMKKLKELMK